MSEQMVMGAKLKDYHGPEFPRALRRAQKRFRYHPERMWQQLFDEVAHALFKGRVRMYPRTSDGYHWAASISFVFQNVRVKITLPMMHDSKKGDGSYADRHMALYTQHVAMDRGFHAHAAEHFANVFNEIYRSNYSGAIKQSKAEAAEASPV